MQYHDPDNQGLGIFFLLPGTFSGPSHPKNQGLPVNFGKPHCLPQKLKSIFLEKNQTEWPDWAYGTQVECDNCATTCSHNIYCGVSPFLAHSVLE